MSTRANENPSPTANPVGDGKASYNLKGKVALVTGAGGQRGIGRAIALRLAAEGAHVVISDIRESNGPDAPWRGMPDVIREIESMGSRAIGIAADISDARQVQALFDGAARQMGRLDIVVNNAAAQAGADRVPVVELDETQWDRVHQINCKGTFLCCQAAARVMIPQGRGRIINIASTLGKMGMARYAAYSASKFAVIGLTQSLALELAPHGITCNAICPSLVATERVDEMAAALAPPDTTQQDHRQAMLNQAAMRAPLGRMADVADVAAVAVFLASAESAYLTGLSLSVAGGTQMI